MARLSGVFRLWEGWVVFDRDLFHKQWAKKMQAKAAGDLQYNIGKKEKHNTWKWKRKPEGETQNANYGFVSQSCLIDTNLKCET
jgi:hypothetical protein